MGTGPVSFTDPKCRRNFVKTEFSVMSDVTPNVTPFNNNIIKSNNNASEMIIVASLATICWCIIVTGVVLFLYK